MANPEVNLTKRVTIPGRGSRWCPVALAANGKVKPDIVIVNGVEERHPEGTYYIDWHEGGRRRRLAVGQNATDAHARRLAKEAELNARNHGVAIVATEPNGHGRPLPAAVADFLEEKRLGKKHRTHTAYTVALSYFLESCKKQHLEDIERRDLLHFSAFLRDEKVLNPRTCWTNSAS